MANTRKTGTFHGKSNKLGYGGRAAQLKAQGVPGYVIGAIARRKGAAPGQKNYHGSRMKKMNRIAKKAQATY
jgi:hypothetical protein